MWILCRCLAIHPTPEGALCSEHVALKRQTPENSRRQAVDFKVVPLKLMRTLYFNCELISLWTTKLN